ncbi:MgtC/SapB family protein [Ectobacillus panaciterrae]|uniref:MgtC/SapB family protein n=1 Tax=Ectobacillus panaciterrae TaxID=363872 RepID=UPI000686E890|nr:MgtC/SapB family protein [Ectobacillus panaciterrae]
MKSLLVLTVLVNVSHIEFYIRLLIAFIFGVVIGLERARQRKIAGIRTHVLVCLGSCMIMVLSLLNEGPYRDPMRLAAQVISGITFIGAGVIWRDRRNFKHGLTTAANLWISSCLGLVIGYGLYDIAVFTGFLMFLAIQISKGLEKKGFIPDKYRVEQYDDDDDD